MRPSIQEQCLNDKLFISSAISAENCTLHIVTWYCPMIHETLTSDKCNSEFLSKKELECHIGKINKVILYPIPQVDEILEDLENPASVIHPVRGSRFFKDTEPD